uniref:Uncharacterized protein n=1 Tax=Anguilla anguilla TaxID=7936 RepID=A0A0E9VNV9_ANGAN
MSKFCDSTNYSAGDMFRKRAPACLLSPELKTEVWMSIAVSMIGHSKWRPLIKGEKTWRN